jgi:hypothetical protein
MGINIIKGEIKIIIETLEEQYAVINNQNGRIPQIEIDIVMANIRRLYVRLCDLNKLNSFEAKDIPEEFFEIIPEKRLEHTEKIEVQPVIDKIEPEMTFSIKEVISTRTKKEIIEIPLPEPVEEKSEDIFDQTNIPKKENKDPEVIKEKIEFSASEVKSAKPGKKDSVDLFSLAEKETIAGKFKETQKSMHEKIAIEKPDKTLADKIGQSSIVNLKNAIGINDKFLFINELFKGDIQEYNKTIDKLNSYSMIDECTNFLKELKEKFKWSEKPDAYQKLEDLLIRKFL